METVEPVESKELMDQIVENLNSQDVSTSENALEQLLGLTLPKGSPYALPIMKRILDMLEREVVTDSSVALDALLPVCKGLENPEIMECMDRVFVWRNDRHWVLMDLIRSFAPTDGTAEYIISRLHLMRPLQDSINIANLVWISEKFRNQFTPRQIDEFLAYFLTPDALNAPPGPDGTVDYDFDSYDHDDTPALQAFRAVTKLIPRLSSANWRTIGNCFFQLNYTPVEIVPLLYDKQPPQGVDVDALILACYEIASDFRSTNGASYEALRVLMRWQTEMDDRLLAKIATLIISNLGAELPNGVFIVGYFHVRDASAALVNEVLRLQTGSLWNAPLLYALFETFGVVQIRFAPAVEEFRALLKFPAWPRELLRHHISVIVRVVFVSFNYDKVTQEFWTRLCREYPAPEMELLDTFSELIENGVLENSWEALETILESRAYQTANPGPDSLFWQRLRVGIKPFFDLDDPQKRSRACAVVFKSS